MIRSCKNNCSIEPEPNNNTTNTLLGNQSGNDDAAAADWTISLFHQSHHPSSRTPSPPNTQESLSTNRPPRPLHTSPLFPRLPRNKINGIPPYLARLSKSTPPLFSPTTPQYTKTPNDSEKHLSQSPNIAPPHTTIPANTTHVNQERQRAIGKFITEEFPPPKKRRQSCAWWSPASTRSSNNNHTLITPQFMVALSSFINLAYHKLHNIITTKKLNPDDVPPIITLCQIYFITKRLQKEKDFTDMCASSLSTIAGMIMQQITKVNALVDIEPYLLGKRAFSKEQFNLYFAINTTEASCHADLFFSSSHDKIIVEPVAHNPQVARCIININIHTSGNILQLQSVIPCGLQFIVLCYNDQYIIHCIAKLEKIIKQTLASPECLQKLGSGKEGVVTIQDNKYTIEMARKELNTTASIPTKDMPQVNNYFNKLAYILCMNDLSDIFLSPLYTAPNIQKSRYKPYMTLTRYLELHEQCFNKDCLKDFLNKLRFLHQQGFIISDSKPDNFLVQITPLSLKPILVRIDFDLDTQYLNELSVSPIAALKCYIFDIVQTLFFNFTAIIDGKQLLSNTHIETDACEEIIEQAHVLYCLHVEYKEEFLLVFEDDLITNKDIILDNATLPTSSSPSQITYLSRIAAITDELEVKINSLEHELAQLCATQQTNQSNDANNTKDALQHSDTITHDEYNSIKDLKISLGKFYKISKHLFAPQTVNMDIFLKSLSDDTCYNYSESVRKLFCIEHIKQAANIDLYTFFELSIDTSTPYTKADFIRSGIGKSPYVSRLLFAALEDDIQLSLRTIMSTIVNFSDGGAFMVIQWRLFKISNRLFTEDMRPIKELRTYNDDGDVVYEVPCYDEIIDGCTE